MHLSYNKAIRGKFMNYSNRNLCTHAARQMNCTCTLSTVCVRVRVRAGCVCLVYRVHICFASVFVCRTCVCGPFECEQLFFFGLWQIESKCRVIACSFGGLCLLWMLSLLLAEPSLVSHQIPLEELYNGGQYYFFILIFHQLFHFNVLL